MIWDDDEERRRHRRLRRGEKRCKHCGLPFVPLPRQRREYCPLHKERRELRQAMLRSRRYRRRRRLLAQVYLELVVRKR